ncbi:hypothetical protein HYPSUDRAFT_38100 [Hypholoma sublateritium FD-334 SS-4]|uniref:Nephrocystin 3-like N-terminal domain-containing protein n=1 Tax=Hypholoma sublateritium (strain FD-334 SS-4) TaxID=945553 RepID=A0A0D2MMH4_HYPSF|nr:hypothetical protein HYPSUDRAFT_38100 [Hypholoma sublateritium FD-334 SS-4]
MSMFDRSQSVVIHGGTFTAQQISTVGPTQSLSEAFKILQSKVAPGAFHNSGERFDPPKCHPRTRRAVIERIMNWILGKESMNSLIMWLNGAAGAGKSAIAQTIAELCYEAGILLASFFFSKSDPHRNHAMSLFPTLAYQIACAIPEARVHLERVIDHDPLIFTRSLEAQMVALIVEPLRPLIAAGYFTDPATSMRLIILDGLDEVVEHRMQGKILEVLSNVLLRHRIPLIILVASRPEQQISFSFDSKLISPLTDRLRLDDKFRPDDDIRLFLDDSFSEIKATHPRKSFIPESWPSVEVMDTLVCKSSGQFVYASTVAIFVASIRHRPTDRLEIVLGLRPVHRDLPFAELDALYIHILSVLEDLQRTLLVIGAVLLGTPCTTSEIEHLLDLDAGDAELLLADLASLVSLEGDETKTIRILHASFEDFIFDSSRSGMFSIDEQAMRTQLACLCLRHLNIRKYGPLDEDWDNKYGFMIYDIRYHLMGKPTAELVDHLSQLSWEVLLDDIRLHQGQFPDNASSNSRLVCAWPVIPIFISAIKSYDLEESVYLSLQTRLYDSVMKAELDILQGDASKVCTSKIQPSLTFLLCLCCEIIHRRFHSNVMQLAGWNSAALIFGFLSPFIDFHIMTLHGVSSLREFLHNASRSGRYYLDAEKYADASSSCLNYLGSHRLAVFINLHHTRRNVTARCTSPYKTRQLMKYVEGRRVWKEYKLSGTNNFASYLKLRDRFPKLAGRLIKKSQYSSATKLGLIFLPKALRLSAKSDALIAFSRGEKSFSQRALEFPALVKKCREALAAYLARVEGVDNESYQSR